jgi:hypothetical protein
MAFQTPITIRKALQHVHDHDYALPAIQREFVWSREKIAMLFDSLMRGYPIGSFLFWSVTEENSKKFVFYDFIRNYHQLSGRHCPRFELLTARPLTAILDGQQRLTALNIGLCGSHAEKIPKLWYNNPLAYPKRELYLDLCHTAEDDELGFVYRFDFRDANGSSSEGEHWFRVGDILELQDGPPMMEYLQHAELATHPSAYATLWRLHRIVHSEPVLAFYEEEDQDLDRVLHIFVRLNSQGEPLSHSDLLLSIATAQWDERDAREEIYALVDELNQIGQGFNLTKDVVLKAGLVMTDATDIRFRVANFSHANMKKLEAEWDRIAAALRLAVRLLANFGFSERTMTANSPVITIADYLFQRGAGDNYVTSTQYAEDRGRIRLWTIRSLIKAGIWGSGLDTLLARLRREIREHGKDGFPFEQIETSMVQGGKSLRFEKEEVDDLVDLPYGNRRVFSILALLYSSANTPDTVFHEDHVFPRSRFTKARLLNAGIAEDAVDAFIEKADRMPNLQLLPGPVNVAKQDMLPADWWEQAQPDSAARKAWLAFHDLGGLPGDIADFLEFYKARRARMVERLNSLLATSQQAEGSDSGSASGNAAATEDSSVRIEQVVEPETVVPGGGQRLVLVWQLNPGPARIHSSADCPTLSNSTPPSKAVRFEGRGTAGWLPETEALLLPDGAVCERCG